MILRRHLLPPLLLVGVLGAACSSGDGDEGAEATTTDAPSSTSTTATSTSTTSAPTSTTVVQADAASLDGRFDQILGWLNGRPLDESTFDVTFADEFRAQVTHAQLMEVGTSFLPAGPWRTVGEDRSPDGNALIARLSPSDGSDDLEMTLVVRSDAGARIETLLFTPTVDIEPVGDIEVALDELAALGELAVGAFDVGDAACGAPLLGLDPERQAPIGSAFKLWVLAAVVDAVGAGTLTWDAEVTIEDRFDSLPSGITQDDPAGSAQTVRTLAERMIAISDNTATDLLIDAVGRDAVEAALVTAGHAAPELNRPFLTTRELFVLKLDDAIRSDYLIADETGRRELLAGPVADADLDALLPAAAAWTSPVDVDAAEWFASPADLCRVLVRLADDDEARAVLSIEPGALDEAGRWSYVGFKGGSEPGVLNLSWLVEDESGGRYVIAGSVWSTTDLIDETTAAFRLTEVRDLIAR